MKQILYRIFIYLLYLASEFEARILDPHGRFPLRRRYLTYMGMRVPKKFSVGLRPTIRKAYNLEVGERFALGDNVTIVGHGKISIGEDFTGASGLHIDSGTHDACTLEAKALPISIGSRVWCGIEVTIIAGVTIGDDCVIGAGSVVTKSIPPSSVAVGSPAKAVKQIDRCLASYYPVLL